MVASRARSILSAFASHAFTSSTITPILRKTRNAQLKKNKTDNAFLVLKDRLHFFYGLENYTLMQQLC